MCVCVCVCALAYWWGGGGHLPPPPNKIKPCLIFNSIYKLTHIVYMSSSRNFLLRYAPDCTFSSRKMKKLPTPPSHTLPLLGRYAPSQRLCLPNVLAHYATVCVCVFMPAYKLRIYPWLNTDEARIFDKARTSHFVFSLD